MPKPILIDLSKDSDTFIFDKKKDARLAMIPKSASGLATKSLFAGSGFMVLPTPMVAKSVAKKSLNQPKGRKAILNSLLREKPIAGLTAVLDLEDQSQLAAMGKVKIETASTAEEEDLFESTTITISFKKDQRLSTAGALKGLKIFDASRTALSTKSIAPAAIPKSGAIESFDAFTEVAYHDENGIEVFTEYLIPETKDDLRPDGLYLKFKGIAADNVTGPEALRPKGRFFKTIVLRIKKFIGVIKKALLQLKESTAGAIVKALEKIPKIAKKVDSRYEILKYDFTNKSFDPLDRKDIRSEIDLSLKTLIILHGTVKGSFNGRFKKKPKNDGKGSYKYLYGGENNIAAIDDYDHWFEYLAAIQSNHAIQYDQIITLEHETVLHDPKKNVAQFRKLLHFDALQFEQPVSLITASRGSLLAKYMAQPASNIPFTIDRTAIVAGGYSQYFEEKGGARNFLISLTKLFGLNGPLKFLLSLSLDIITKLPGLDVQNQNSARFKYLISDPTDVTYFNFVNDFHGTDIKSNTMERIVADPILGPENDFALSMAAQMDHRPGQVHPLFPPLPGNNVHGKGLRLVEYRRALAEFLGADLGVVS